MKEKGLFVIVYCICLVFFLFGQPAMSAEQKVLKIGGLFSLTGWISSWEADEADGLQMGMEWINEKGGIRINGEKYNVQVVVEDMKSTAEGAAAAATKLAYDHKVKFAIGGIVPFMTIGSGQVMEQAKVLRFIMYNMGTPEEYGPHTPYGFVTHMGTKEGMASSLDYFKEIYPKMKNVVFINPDDGSAPSFDKFFRQEASARGLNVLSTLIWAMNTQDFTPIITKALAANPEAIVFSSTGQYAMGSSLKIARAMGFKGPMFAGCGDDPVEVRTVAGKEASDNYWVHNFDLNNTKEMTPIMQEYLKWDKTRKPDKGRAYRLYSFLDAHLFKYVIERAQSLDPTVVRDKWEKWGTVDTIYGRAKMGGLKTYGINHTVCAPIPIVGLDKGEVVWKKWINYYSP